MGTRITVQGAEKVYQAASLWVERALKSDDSLFTPGQAIWSSKWLGEARQLLLSNDDASGNFIEWWEQRLQDSLPEVYQLFGETLYVFFLTPNTPKDPQNKRQQIKRVLEKSSLALDIPSDLGDALAGLMGGGRGFQSSRPYYLGFLIEFAEQWKKQLPAEKNRLLDDPWAFKGFVQGLNFQSVLLQNNPNAIHAQREALLHLVHPDTFEGMVSIDHKNRVTKTFKDLTDQATDDVDRQLEQIHRILEPHYGAGTHFFYKPEIHRQWNSELSEYTGKTYPENGGAQPPDGWDDFVRQALYVDSGKLEADKINKREMGKDLVAARRAVLDSAPNWHEMLLHALRSRGGDPIDWRLLDDFNQWCSGYTEQALAALQTLWRESNTSVAERIHAFVRMSPDSPLRGKGSAYGSSMSVISGLLMGLDVERHPPFRAGMFDYAYARTGYKKPGGRADEVTLYEHALGFLDRFIQEASERGLELQHRLDAQSVVWGIWEIRESEPEDTDTRKVGWAALAEELLWEREQLQDIVDDLEEKGQVIFYGPPGTGKTYVAQKIAEECKRNGGDYEIVQFHPSYSYEDFVEGFRPKLINGQPGFDLVQGPLRRIAEQARRSPNATFVLIIDELNRGNLSKVLGELYFLLEYRNEVVRLQYGGDREGFSLPCNLWFICTMNTADKSIALMDAALRRRFYFYPFFPDKPAIKGLLRRWLKKNGQDTWVADLVDTANRKLERDSGIGPSYFMRPGQTLDERRVRRIWERAVMPYIEEQYFGDEAKLREFALDRLKQDIDGVAPDASSKIPDGTVESAPAQASDADSNTG